MKLLINICGHDGIVSYYNGVGTMMQRYIEQLNKILKKSGAKYYINLFTPEYNNDSFGYNEKVHSKHNSMDNVKIYQVSNGSDGKINYGTPNNWEKLCKNTASIINNMDQSKYDGIITIYNDTPFACLANYLKQESNHITVLILHSTVKIHRVDSAIKNSYEIYNKRLEWENNAIKYINNNRNCYYGYIGEYILEHLINEYGLNKEKSIKIFNGEVICKKRKPKFSQENRELFKKIKNKEKIIISFGRAEEYKNLEKAFILGKALNIPAIVVAQLYYKGQPIEKKYQKVARKTNGILYIDPPFDYAKYILHNFKNQIICLIPSDREIMGLIINEVRNFKKKNILIVANNVNGLKEQINDEVDGILVDLNNIKDSKEKIEKNLNNKKVKELMKKGYERIKREYNIENNFKEFLDVLLYKF